MQIGIAFFRMFSGAIRECDCWMCLLIVSV